MTALFEDIIFGPVHSRRLGLSLGINLLPIHAKICNFDCAYCECGLNGERRGASDERRFNARRDVRIHLEAALRRMVAAAAPPDVITFAGNGEPTLHPEFAAVIDDTIALRDAICPSARVSVLSNATRIDCEEVREALLRVDNNILKLDSAFDETVRVLNAPCGVYSVAKTVEQLQLFNGRFILQTMFIRGMVGETVVDNTTEREVAAWIEIIKKIRPQKVMVYSLDRPAPCATLQKVPREELEIIAGRVESLGIECSVA